jgi:hypothetical protein
MKHWVPGGLSLLCNTFNPISQELYEDEKRVVLIVAFRRLRLKALRAELKTSHKRQFDPEYMTLQAILKPWDPYLKTSAVFHEALDHWPTQTELELSHDLRLYARQGREEPSDGKRCPVELRLATNREELEYISIRQLAKEHLKLLKKQLRSNSPAEEAESDGETVRNLFWPVDNLSKLDYITVEDDIQASLDSSDHLGPPYSPQQRRKEFHDENRAQTIETLRAGSLPHLADGIMDHPLKGALCPLLLHQESSHIWFRLSGTSFNNNQGTTTCAWSRSSSFQASRYVSMSTHPS